MHIKFSSYVIMDTAGSSLDPLGIQSSFSSMTSKIFPQFTVLSNYPRYHIVLCAIIDYIQKRADARQFALIFREYENLWGIAQTVRSTEDTDALAPVNVTKYKPVIEELGSHISFGAVSRKNYPTLFQRLGYGALGFYLAPSKRWGLVSDKRIPENTPIGKQLGDLLLNDFRVLFDMWRDGKNISFTSNLFKIFGEKTAINPEFSRVPKNEKSVWKDILELFIQKQSPSSFYKNLWDYLPSMEYIASVLSDQETYGSFFPTMIDIYSDNDKVTAFLDYCNHFEQFTTAFEFLFELEYALIQNSEFFSEEALLEIKEEVFAHLKGAAPFLLKDTVYLKRGLQKVLEDFQNCKSWEKGFVVMTKRHMDVQGGKKKRPFFDESHSLFQLNQVPFNRVKNAVETFEESGFKGVRHAYRRDWHFMRAARYKEFIS